MLRKLLRYLYLAFLVAPASAILLAALFHLIASLVSGLYFDIQLILGIGYPTGLSYGILTAWFVLKYDIPTILRYLGGAVLLFGLPLTLVPEAGLVLSWLSGGIGYWLGLYALKREILGGIAYYASLKTDN